MWDEIINDDLFIGQSAAGLMQEISSNTWLISMSAAERAETTSSDLTAFFQAVIENRREQQRHSQSHHGMWFYVWHDRQAAQLRFCLISDVHQKLPFGCQTIPATLDVIIEEFLGSPAHIPLSTFDIFETDTAQDDDLAPFVLPVFVAQL